MKRAETGDRTALAELLGRAAQAKLAPAYRALGRGYFKIGQLDAGLRAYRSGGALEPQLSTLRAWWRGSASTPGPPCDTR